MNSEQQPSVEESEMNRLIRHLELFVPDGGGEGSFTILNNKMIEKFNVGLEYCEIKGIDEALRPLCVWPACAETSEIDTTGGSNSAAATVLKSATVVAPVKTGQAEYVSTTERATSSGDGERVNLSFLKPLRDEGKRASEEASQNLDVFLPAEIYVRTSMRFIFHLFRKDNEDESVRPKGTRTQLIGSPGVGKSILCFLAALHRAQHTVGIYYRRTRAVEDVSAFIMFPSEQGFHVLFTRKLDPEDFGNLSLLNKFFRTALGIKREQYFCFVDGPRYTKEVSQQGDILFERYDYFCTSGGHPPPTSEGQQGNRMWVLDAWSEDEATSVLQKMGNDKQKADRAYWLCGGSIRDMLFATTLEGYKSLENTIAQNFSYFFKGEELAVESSERSAGSRDRFRRMFWCGDYKTSTQKIVQIVDSQFLLQLACGKIDLQRFLDGYALGALLNGRALQGWSFEYMVHGWFESKKPAPMASACRSVGTAAQGVAMLHVLGSEHLQFSCDRFCNYNWRNALHISDDSCGHSFIRMGQVHDEFSLLGHFTISQYPFCHLVLCGPE
jgi:hypothetical protein